jgi:hypothetical protein
MSLIDYLCKSYEKMNFKENDQNELAFYPGDVWEKGALAWENGTMQYIGVSGMIEKTKEICC